MSLHPLFSYRVEYIGKEAQPILIIENYIADPESLIDYCARFCHFKQADAYYPGVRAPAPDAYVQVMNYYLNKIVYDTFGVDGAVIKSAQSDFSMVITPPEQLKPIQCTPHYDSLLGTELAAVHYLCNASMGGTSFYRHRATGFEYIDKARAATYTNVIKEQALLPDYPKQYMNGSNDFFEQIASFSAVFNRLIIYRCTSLHSGNIASGFLFDPNPRTGRLTINTFLYN
ncbi:MAG: hypothetical protein B0W54_11690 [Cellvibrio sp. 79]|nr:MAG: hypothetical protein B0W54_11690 [Cellvibrio sp. 79]